MIPTSGSLDGAGRLGAAVGAAAAACLLAAAAVLLLSREATSAKVLVAVWLWALPVLGLGSLAGWACGRAVVRLVRRRGR